MTVVAARPSAFVHDRDQSPGPGFVGSDQATARQHGAGDKVTQARCPPKDRARSGADPLRC